jgi:glyoxylase I family protein
MQVTGVDHLGLTVTDLDRATAWYCEHLDFEPLVRYANAAAGAEVQVLRRADGPLRFSLRRFTTGSSEPFSEFRVGMDHVALGVPDESALAGWHSRLEGAGISCSRTDLRELSILAFRDPDNIQIELCTPMKPASTSDT